MAYYQISSGNGPAECERAVALFLEWLDKNHKIEILESRPSREEGCFRSAWLKSDEDLESFTGTIRWTAQSPFRPHHKRKNWFINFQHYDAKELESFDESQVVFQTMRAGGNGGQNVNKVESAVRATYLPDSFSTVCREERSQHLNRKRALERIKIHVLESANKIESEEKKEKWSQHNNLQRGQAAASFFGEKFEFKT